MTLLWSFNHFGPYHIVRRTRKSVWFDADRWQFQDGAKRRKLHFVPAAGGTRCETFYASEGGGHVSADTPWRLGVPDGGFHVYNE